MVRFVNTCDKRMVACTRSASLVLKEINLFVVKLFHAVNIVFTGMANLLIISLRRICWFEVPNS